MNKSKIVMPIIILILIGICLFLFLDNKKKTKTSNINSSSNIENNSDNNADSNSNSNSDNNSNIENNYNDNSNIESNSNSNSNNNTNSNNSNIESNSNSNKSNSNSNTNDNYLKTNGSFSGIFQSDNHIAHMLQINNKVHFYIYNRKTKSTVTIHGNVSGKTLTADRYNISFTLKDKGLEFTSTNDNLGKGYIPKIKEYTNSDYFEEFMHGNKNGIRGIYTNKYGTIKIYQVYNSQLRIYGTVKKKNANTDSERNRNISGGTLLNWNSSKKIWYSDQYGEDCNVKSPCEWITLRINNNEITVESDSSTINNIFFHIGKYFDESKNKTEPNANVYTKTSDYSINQIVNDVF